MKAYLDEVSDYLLSQHTQSELSDMVLVFPSRRSAYFLQRSLSGKVKEVMRSPKILAMDDFMQELSMTDRADGIELLFDLFSTFQTLHSAISLEKFMGWGPVLLKDFDLIDQYAIENPQAFFDYLTEAKALERWGVLPGEPASKVQSNYFSLYQQIAEVFPLFREKLRMKQRVYRGLAYRLAQERVVAQPQTSSPYTFHYFIGLNALSKTEEQVIKKLMDVKLADTLWDSDVAYEQGTNRAGLFLRKHKKNSLKGNSGIGTNDFLNQLPRTIHFIPVTASIWQAQMAAQRYCPQVTSGVKNATGWILNDESLLPALMEALPSEVESVNITMGLSLRQSLVYSFMMAVLELQLHHRSVSQGDRRLYIPSFTIPLLQKVYQHPMYALFRENQSLSVDAYTLYLDQNPFVKEEEFLALFENDSLGKLVFSRWPQGYRALSRMKEVLHVLRLALVGEAHVMENEFLFTLLMVCQRLEKSIPAQLSVSLGLIRQLFQDIVRQERVPFSGEPVAELQIMSMLETRCLDFEKVVLFHANEGFLPAPKKTDSLIPFDLAREFGLPIYSDQDSVMAYHFFRLLQRAKEVDIYYVIPSGKGLGGGKEPSRFLRQLQQMNLEHTKIQHWTLQKPTDAWEEGALEPWQKTEELRQSLVQWLHTTGFSPTTLDTWLRCERKFLMKHVWRWKELEEETETMGADLYGQLIHKILEIYFLQFPVQQAENAKLFKAQLPEILEAQVNEKPFSQFDFQTGYHALIKKIAIDQLSHYLDSLIADSRVHHVMGMEFTLQQEIHLSFDFPIKLKARVDQQEQVDGKIKLIDFKTGHVKGGDLSKNMFQKLAEPKEGKLRQLWLYQYLMWKQNRVSDAEASLISLRDVKIHASLPSIEKVGNVQEFQENSEKWLQELVRSMLDPSTPIQSAAVPEDCSFCGFRLTCGK